MILLNVEAISLAISVRFAVPRFLVLGQLGLADVEVDLADVPAGIVAVRQCPHKEDADLERHEDHVRKEPVNGQSGNGDVPLLLRQVAHFVDRPLAQDHSVQMTVFVVALHVAVEGVGECVRVERVEVVGLAERVHCELPVAGCVVLIGGEALETRTPKSRTPR